MVFFPDGGCGGTTSLLLLVFTLFLGGLTPFDSVAVLDFAP